MLYWFSAFRTEEFFICKLVNETPPMTRTAPSASVDVSDSPNKKTAKIMALTGTKLIN